MRVPSGGGSGILSRPSREPVLTSSSLLPSSPVSQTALWTAWVREQEGKKARPLLEDPLASHLLRDQDRAFAASLEKKARAADAIVLRHAWMDQELFRLVVTEGSRAVMEMGCGLSTRPWRIAWPGNLHWVDGDDGALLALKQERMGDVTPRCIYRALPIDLRSPEALAEQARQVARLNRDAGASAGPVFVLEGVLPYLAEDEVRSLLRALRTAAPGCFVVCDVVSPWFISRVGAGVGRATGEVGAPLQFSTADPARFFAGEGYTSLRTVSLVDAGRASGRWPLLKWLPVPKRVRDLSTFLVVRGV